MRNPIVHQASQDEIDYILALSRESTISAYTNWNELSIAEKLCVDLYMCDNPRVLDLGCGTGRIPRTIGSRLDSYLGIDCSVEMINAARSQNPRFNFLCEDILEPSFEERNFNVVMLMNNVVDMLHPIGRRQNIFELTKSYLVASGVLIFSSHLLNNNTQHGYYEEDYHGALVKTYRSSFSHLCEEVENHGFEVKHALRDYRAGVADWAYIVASPKNNKI